VVTLRLHPQVYEHLRLLARKWDAPQGDVIEALLDAAQTCYELRDDPAWREQFWAIFDISMLNAGAVPAGWRRTEDKAVLNKAREKVRRRREAHERIEAARKAGHDTFLY